MNMEHSKQSYNSMYLVTLMVTFYLNENKPEFNFFFNNHMFFNGSLKYIFYGDNYSALLHGVEVNYILYKFFLFLHFDFSNE